MSSQINYSLLTNVLRTVTSVTRHTWSPGIIYDTWLGLSPCLTMTGDSIGQLWIGEPAKGFGCSSHDRQWVWAVIIPVAHSCGEGEGNLVTVLSAPVMRGPDQSNVQDSFWKTKRLVSPWINWCAWTLTSWRQVSRWRHGALTSAKLHACIRIDLKNKTKSKCDKYQHVYRELPDPCLESKHPASAERLPLHVFTFTFTRQATGHPRGVLFCVVQDMLSLLLMHRARAGPTSPCHIPP